MKKQLGKKAWSKKLDNLKKLPPPVIERTPACAHMELTKVVANDTIYQCKNPECRAVVYVFGAAMATPETWVRNNSIIARILSEDDPKLKKLVKTILTADISEQEK